MRGGSSQTLIDSLFNLASYGTRIPQDFETRNSQNLLPEFGQILVAALIMLATLFGLMILAIDLND